MRQNVKPFEVIVIEDASSNNLPIIEDLSSIKILRSQRELGLGQARSLGSRLAKGSIIAFLDDDAIADEQWLQEIIEAFKGEVDIVGGLTTPLYLSSIPWWWDDKVLGFLVGVRNDCLTDNPLTQVFGCNFAVKKKVLEDLGYFHPKLGRYKGKQFGGEDTLLLLRASQEGFKLYFNKKSVIYHKVSPERLTLRYLLKRAWYSGASWRLIFGLSLNRLMDYMTLVRAGRKKKAQSKWSAKITLFTLRFIQMLGYMLGYH